MVSALSAWVLLLMTTLQPNAPWSNTYPTTADAIAEAAEEQPVFDGPGAEPHTAALLVSLGWHESRFKIDARDQTGGDALGLFQIERTNIATPFLQEAVLREPLVAARAALKLIRKSREICRGRPVEDMLGWYAWGRVGCSHSLDKSRHRVWKAQWLERAFPFAVDAT